MIHIDYCPDWTLADARRELMQNALDAGLIAHTSHRLVSKGHIDPRSFILGYSSKRADSSKLGQFGEGLKLAMLVFEREAQPINIYAADKRYTTERVEVKGETTIDIVAYDCPSDDQDNTVIVFSQAQDWSSTYIDPTPRILPYKPELYIGGLHICSLEGKFTHGYVLRPGTVTLNRDRKSADPWQIALYAKNLLLESTDFSDRELAQLVVDANHMDGTYLDNIPRLEQAVLDLLDEMNIRPTYKAGGYYTGITSAAASYIKKGTVLTKEQKRLTAFLKANKRRMSKEARAELTTLIGKLHA